MEPHRQYQGAKAINRVEGAVNQAGPALEFLIQYGAPDELDDHSQEAADKEHPEQLVKVEPVSEGTLPPLARVRRLGIGRFRRQDGMEQLFLLRRADRAVR